MSDGPTFQTRHPRHPLRPERVPWRLKRDNLARYFFTAHAFLAVLILALITIFLFKEGAGFFAMNREHLSLYRRSGLELVEQLKKARTDLGELQRFAEERLAKSVKKKLDAGLTLSEAHARTVGERLLFEQLEEALKPLDGVYFVMRDEAMRLRDDVLVYENNRDLKEQLEAAANEKASQGLNLEALRLQREAEQILLEPVDYEARLQPILEKIPEAAAALEEVGRRLEVVFAPGENGAAEPFQSMLSPRMLTFLQEYSKSLPETAQRLAHWDSSKPIHPLRPYTTFLFGGQWLTSSYFQDWFGLLPLLFGSLIVAAIALSIAVPFGLAAAIYVNKVASPREQSLLKPGIEFIAALPSVVIGFFGVAVWGQFVRWVSQFDGLSWLPFFPLAERLNAFTAGCLLALMAIPTIFTLAEEALENVPRKYLEGSYALGANRWQTTLHIVLPGALPGIISAVLLGFGRVVGETMVVLLCAGNRIDIPDFTQGAGVIFEPVHTMTGIIAQEMGEVVQGSLHYRALFMVGLVLFLLSLGINFAAQKILRQRLLKIS
jgi:phosphate transport system permease protein